MKPIIIVATTLVNIALINYSIFLYHERKQRIISDKVLLFLTLGVLFDISATICMIIGSSHGPFTLHGILGYSSLTGMLIDSLLIWKSKFKYGIKSPINIRIHKYSLISYLWWVAAYITGFLIVITR
jgi:hypothetical protein